QTVSHEELASYGSLFYRARRKVVPEQIRDIATARTLAYWFMDDGSMKSRQSKGVIFNTQAYDSSDIRRLIDVLEGFGLEAWKSQESSDKSYPGDNRLITPKRSQRRRGLAPQVGVTSWKHDARTGL